MDFPTFPKLSSAPKTTSSLVVSEQKQAQPPAHVEDTKVPKEEIGYYLRKCLKPVHYDDPNIMKWIAEYLHHRDAGQAAEAIGLARRDGASLKRRPDIAECIRQITAAAVFKHDLDPGEIVAKFKEVLDVDLVEFENDDGSYKKSLKDISPEMRRAIKSITLKNTYELDPNGMKVITGEIIKIELWDKLKAGELLGREGNLFKETKSVKHEIGESMSALLLESKQRAVDVEARYRDVSQETTVEFTEVIPNEVKDE